jgi:hypothetical protein
MSKRYQGGILGVGFNPLQAPNAPTIGTATAGGNNCASVPFTAPANVGGSAITSYTYRSNPAGFSGAAAGSPFAVTGLSTGTSYTFGVFALNSYGPSPSSAFSNSITAVLDGTFGIFALGCTCGNSTTRNKYTYAGCVVSAGGAATVASRCGSAAGNSTVGIFALGSIVCGGSNTLVTTRNKYTYSGCVVSAGGAATIASSQGSAAGNSTVGIFALSTTGTFAGTANRNKYTYSGCVVSAGGAASTSSVKGAAVGNSTVGIFALGANSSSGARLTTRDKYTYSGCVVSAGGAATVASCSGSAAGNSTVGIFALGYTSAGGVTTRNKYTYSGCVVSAGGAATAASSAGSAAGNSTVGIFALGEGISTKTTTRNRYTYSNDAVAAGGAATAASFRGSAAANGIAGITL